MALVGPSDNAPDELAVADVVAIPSVWESGPLVLAEALVLGRPVVATPVGLVPGSGPGGESGRIVPVGDARALADGHGSDLLADPAGAAAMAEAGQRAVEQVLGADAARGGHRGAVPEPPRPADERALRAAAAPARGPRRSRWRLVGAHARPGRSAGDGAEEETRPAGC